MQPADRPELRWSPDQLRGDWAKAVRSYEQARLTGLPDRIAHHTPLVPQVIARSVWEEAAGWLQVPLPREWIGWLVHRSEEVYASNPRFRRRLHEPGDRGRDWLWTFMRHWLASLISDLDGELVGRLPPGIGNGLELPVPSTGRLS